MGSWHVLKCNIFDLDNHGADKCERLDLYDIGNDDNDNSIPQGDKGQPRVSQIPLGNKYKSTHIIPLRVKLPFLSSCNPVLRKTH